MTHIPLAETFVLIRPIVEFSHQILKFFGETLGLPWGVAIIFLTFVIRLLILPLTFKSVKSMQALQQLQPEIKRIQERYKDDRQRMNQEMMKFYQEHKVNPLGSCLPILLQLPFFFALFVLLRSDEFKADIKGDEGFLFIPNLAEKLTDRPVALAFLVVLYVATQLGASAVTMISADPTQKRIMYALPFVFSVFIINFQAGLIVYWITTNVWTFGQQLVVRKLYPKPPPIEPRDDDREGGKPARGKPPAEVPAGEGAKAGGRKKQAKPATDGAKAGAKQKPTAAKAKAKAAGADDGNGRTSKPPASPRRKKKRSGRRR
jgi:YidC/Oxa1 family membrane protein insertase